MISDIYSLEQLFIQHVENGDLCFLSTYKYLYQMVAHNMLHVSINHIKWENLYNNLLPSVKIIFGLMRSMFGSWF